MASASASSHTHLKKRIIVCCDGTWMDSDGSIQTPSNVTRIARSIAPVGMDHATNPPTPISQVTFYQNGIGTGAPSLYTRYIGGATGEGMSLNIREAYAFICLNYHPGDEIFLIGFSRGAFTARSVSSLIHAVGLLTPEGLKYLIQIFEDWEYQLKSGWTTSFPDEPWSHRPPLDTPEYRRKLLELELTQPDIPIKCVAVWDTVGALGIPMIGLFPQPPSTDFSFVDTKVERNIEYAYQALALDEHRRNYTPTIWEKPTSQPLPKVLKQVWFPGVHSDIGGSYASNDLANLTLAWMITQLTPLLTINTSTILKEIRLSIEHHTTHHEPVREWSLGKIHNSMTPFFRLYGSTTRTPKEYFSTSSPTRRLENTNERLHSSVRIRMGRRGLGYNDKGTYDSNALTSWTMTGQETQPDTPIAQGLPGAAGGMKDVVWKKVVNRGQKDEQVLEMAEDEIGGFERVVLRLWPELETQFESVRPGRHLAEVKRAQTFPGVGEHVSGAGVSGALTVDTGGLGQKAVERTGTI